MKNLYIFGLDANQFFKHLLRKKIVEKVISSSKSILPLNLFLQPQTHFFFRPYVEGNSQILPLIYGYIAMICLGICGSSEFEI